MKHAILLVCLVILFNSCVKVDPFGLNKACTGSCVTVTGRFTTSNNQPIANVPIAIRSERSPGTYELDVRLIANTKTDDNGYYSLSFALKNYEWGSQASAGIYFKYSYDESQYLPIYNFHKDITLSSSRDAFRTNDTTVIKNFYLPKIAKVNLQLTGFTPPLDYENNYFNVTAFCKAGEVLSEKAVSGLLAEAAVNTKEILVAGDDSTRFHIERRKNGIVSTKDTTIYTPVGIRKDLSFGF